MDQPRTIGLVSRCPTYDADPLTCTNVVGGTGLEPMTLPCRCWSADFGESQRAERLVRALSDQTRTEANDCVRGMGRGIVSPVDTSTTAVERSPCWRD